MVMRLDGVHNQRIHAVALAVLCAELGMRAVLVVVHGLADVVQKSPLLGELDVGAEPRRGCWQQEPQRHGRADSARRTFGARAGHHSQDLGGRDTGLRRPAADLYPRSTKLSFPIEDLDVGGMNQPSR
jgi:hypothetical protein